ncbi:MAG: hypothetical protein MJ131_10470 [Lachnospiraceae bacterium]|nr:hypothetical protein [Lachnospiraceae bacterium]
MNYEKPMVFMNDDLAEGVYAANVSGSPIDAAGECWTIVASPVPSNSTTNNPGWNKAAYELYGVHSTSVKHISASTTIYISFSGDTVSKVEIDGIVVEVGSTGRASYNGFDGKPAWELTVKDNNNLVLVRNLLADSYNSGDNFRFNVLFYGTNGTATVSSITYTCEHKRNVQGDLD